MKAIFLIFFTTIILLSCNTDRNRCLKSNGEVISVETPINNYNGLSIEGVFDIYIQNSNVSTIEITACKNLIPFIKYEVKNKTLTITDDNNCAFLRKHIRPVIILKTPYLKEISINSACELNTIDTLHFDKLSIQNWAGIFKCNLNLEGDSLFFRAHASTGDYRLKGNCKFMYLYNIGSGYFRAAHLKCKYVDVSHRCSGTSEINGSKRVVLENILLGKVISYSEECPEIVKYNEIEKGLFLNLGCPD